jgi:hypothetical protein
MIFGFNISGRPSKKQRMGREQGTENRSKWVIRGSGVHLGRGQNWGSGRKKTNRDWLVF